MHLFLILGNNSLLNSGMKNLNDEINEDHESIKLTNSNETTEKQIQNVEKELAELRDKETLLLQRLAEMQEFINSLAQASISPNDVQELKLVLERISNKIDENPMDRPDREMILSMIREKLLPLERKNNELLAIIEQLAGNITSPDLLQEMKAVVDLLASKDNKLLNDLQRKLENMHSKVIELEKKFDDYNFQRSSSTDQRIAREQNEINNVKLAQYNKIQNTRENIEKIMHATTLLINYKSTA